MDNQKIRKDIQVLVNGLSQDALYKIYMGSLLNSNSDDLTDVEHLYILSNIDDLSLIELLEGEMHDTSFERPINRIFVEALIQRLKKKCGI